MNLGPYAKAVAGVLAAGYAAYSEANSDGLIEIPEYFTIAGAMVTAAVAIFFVLNGGRFGPYAKAIAAGLVTTLGALGTAWIDGTGLSVPEIITGIVKGLISGFTISQIPNAEESDNLVVHDLSGGDPELAGHANLDTDSTT